MKICFSQKYQIICLLSRIYLKANKLFGVYIRDFFLSWHNYNENKIVGITRQSKEKKIWWQKCEFMRKKTMNTAEFVCDIRNRIQLILQSGVFKTSIPTFLLHIFPRKNFYIARRILKMEFNAIKLFYIVCFNWCKRSCI